MRKSALNTSALLRVFAGSGVIKIFQSLLSVLVGVLLARFLEPDGYGRYSFAFAIISLLAIPAQSGLPTLLVREVARLSESQQWQTMKRLILWSGWVIAIVSSILVVIPLVFRVYIESAMGREAFDVFLLGLPLIPILALSYARAGVIKGLSFVLRGQLPEFIVLPGVFSVAVLIFGLAGYLSPESAMLLYTGAAVVSFAVGGGSASTRPSSAGQSGKS